MEDEDNVEDRLQCQLAGLSLSSTEKPPYYQRRDITPSLHDKFCSPGGETAFLGQGPPTSHNFHRHGVAAAPAQNGQQLQTLEEDVIMRWDDGMVNLRRIWEEMKVLKDENMELRKVAQSLQAKLEQTEVKLKQSEKQCYALGVHLAMAMPPNG